MNDFPKGPKIDAVKNMRAFIQRLRDETRTKSKKKAEERLKRIKQENKSAKP